MQESNSGNLGSSLAEGRLPTQRPRFTFYEYNQRRAARGAEGVRMEVTWPDGNVELLWMTKRQVALNIQSFGRCDELTKAEAAYDERSKGREDAPSRVRP